MRRRGVPSPSLDPPLARNFGRCPLRSDKDTTNPNLSPFSPIFSARQSTIGLDIFEIQLGLSAN